MKVSLAWRNAVALTDADWCDTRLFEKTGFTAQSLPITLVARFQIDYRPSPVIASGDRFNSLVATDPVPRNTLNAFAHHIDGACRSGLLRSELIRDEYFDNEVKVVAAQDFVEWLATNGMQPSVHIQAWFDEAGVSFGEAVAPEEKPLATRERNTLLTIIAVLCKEAGLEPTKPAKTAGMIQHMAIGMGLQIGETTIETHLKRIPDALESRMK